MSEEFIEEFISEYLPYILRIPCVLIALTVHEVCHGYAALWLGDTTARDAGRLSLNPIHHLSLMGCLFMVFFGFGFAKPVPINPSRFEKVKNRRVGMAITAIAGPLSNFLMSAVGILIYVILYRLNYAGIIVFMTADFAYYVFYVLMMLLEVFIMLNISLAVFNMIPIPPLDGSKILLAFLPERVSFYAYKYERQIMAVLFILIWLGAFSGIISTAVSVVAESMIWCADFIVGIFI